MSPLAAHRDAYYDEIRGLRETCDRQQAKIRQLEGLLRPWYPFPAHWKLRPSGNRILALLYASPDGYRSRDACHRAMYNRDPGTQATKTVDVQVCILRKALAPYAITIDTVWGQGYRLTSHGRALVKQAITA